jgi:Raf kinase inhibitor-like YbhB/YbcL family protein
VPDAGGDAGIETIDAGFALSSPALDAGGTFPVRYTCNDGMTAGRVSLPLAWTRSPLARSYAVVMTDTSINLVHWVIWDIDAAATGLPEGIANVAEPPTPAGARQTTSYDNTTYGYRGPCPPSLHVYRFELSALDVSTLPGVTPTSPRAVVTAAIAAHTIDQATLPGQYGP